MGEGGTLSNGRALCSTSVLSVCAHGLWSPWSLTWVMRGQSHAMLKSSLAGDSSQPQSGSYWEADHHSSMRMQVSPSGIPFLLWAVLASPVKEIGHPTSPPQ